MLKNLDKEQKERGEIASKRWFKRIQELNFPFLRLSEGASKANKDRLKLYLFQRFIIRVTARNQRIYFKAMRFIFEDLSQFVIRVVLAGAIAPVIGYILPFRIKSSAPGEMMRAYHSKRQKSRSMNVMSMETYPSFFQALDQADTGKLVWNALGLPDTVLWWKGVRRFLPYGDDTTTETCGLMELKDYSNHPLTRLGENQTVSNLNQIIQFEIPDKDDVGLSNLINANELLTYLGVRTENLTAIAQARRDLEAEEIENFRNKYE